MVKRSFRINVQSLPQISHS